jgi:hypothetical protein
MGHWLSCCRPAHGMCGEQLDMSPKSKVLGALCEKKFGEETFDLATLEDMAKDGAFNEAIKDR